LSSYPTYRSPIRLLHELGLDTTEINAENLKVERKRLLLELQLAEGQTVQFGNQSYTKNDVINAFEELNGVSDLDFHSTIYQHSDLLNFLENHEVERRIKNVHVVFTHIENKRDKFTHFISPYLAKSIDRLITRVLVDKKFIDLDKIEVLFQLLTPTDAIYAFRKFHSFCESLEEELLGISQSMMTSENGVSIFPKGKTVYLRYRPFYNLTNHVAEYYPNITDTVAKAIITFKLNREMG